MALLPNRVSADGQTYGIKVNGIAVSDTNKDDILSNGKVKYDPTTDTLTVSGNLNSGLEIVGNETVNVVINSDDSTNYLTNGKISISKVNDITFDVDISNRITSYDTTISCTGDFVAKNASCQVFDKLTISSAKNVDISAPLADDPGMLCSPLSSADITCSGSIKIENSNGGSAVGSLKVQNATDVSVIGHGTYLLVSSADISCSGNVLLSNTKGMIGQVDVKKAGNVTATTDKANFRMFNGVLNINCTGNVNISNASGYIGEEGLSIETSGGSVNILGKHSEYLVADDKTFHSDLDFSIKSYGDIKVSNESGSVVYGLANFVSSNGGVEVSCNASSYPCFTNSSSTPVTIDCAGNVLLSNQGTYYLTNRGLHVKKAANVTMVGVTNSNPLTLGDVSINCAGNVEMSNKGIVSNGNLNIVSQGKVSITSNSTSPTLNGSTNIDCAGDLLIENNGNGHVASQALTVTKANSITVKTDVNYPMIIGNLDFNSTGSVILENKSGIVCSSPSTIASANGGVDIRGFCGSKSSSVLPATTTISCAGDVYMENTAPASEETGSVVTGDLNIKKAANVTLLGATASPLVTGGISINCTKDVNIENKGISMITGSGNLIIDAARNVTVINHGASSIAIGADAKINATGNVTMNAQFIVIGGSANIVADGSIEITNSSNAPTICNTATLECLGDILIENTGNNLAVTSLAVKNAKNVTVSSAFATGPTILSDSSITCSGDVLIQNTAGWDAIYHESTFTLSRPTGCPDYVVSAGDSVDALQVLATKKATEVFGPESSEKSVICLADLKYEVSFDLNGHGSTKPDSQNIISGNKATKPADPTASGWTFEGWYEDQACTKAFSFDTAISANLTLYAKWTEDEIPPVNYKIISGANGEWTLGSTDGLTIASDAPFEKLESVMVDGAVIEESNYTAVSGSTIVTLKPSYLESLKEGLHTFEIVSKDGKASTNFTILPALTPTPTPTPTPGPTPTPTPEPNPDPTPTPDPNPTPTPTGTPSPTPTTSPAPDSPLPKTGDDNNSNLFVAILLLSSVTLIGTLIYDRKRKHSN